MSRKNKKKKKSSNLAVVKTPVRPSNFHTFQECVKLMKKSVYMIVRGREGEGENKGKHNWTTLGTGFLAAPNRLLTAAHVVKNPEQGPAFEHKKGDIYYFIKHDDEDNWHTVSLQLELGTDIHLEESSDIAVVYLPDSFYGNETTQFVGKNDFIRIDQDFKPIGSDIGVLGYPLSNLQFEDNDFQKPMIGNVLLRTDKGVINTRFRTSLDHYLYQFTLAFNPGNSGGPIFDVKNGRLVSIVKGFNVITIKQMEVEVSDELKKGLKTYKGDSYIDSAKATYSEGFATPTFENFLRSHGVL